jgi:LEA14-like dessication related protein
MPYRKHSEPFALFILLVLLSAIMGCATLGNTLEPPELSLVALRVKDVKALEAAFDIDLRVLNRGDRPLAIQGLECDLSLNERKFARGVANPQKEIAPYSSDILTLTVYSSVLDMVPVIQRLLKDRDPNMRQHIWTYAIKGHLRMPGTGPWNKIQFKNRGEIDMAAMGNN